MGNKLIGHRFKENEINEFNSIYFNKKIDKTTMNTNNEKNENIVRNKQTNKLNDNVMDIEANSKLIENFEDENVRIENKLTKKESNLKSNSIFNNEKDK